MERYCVLPMNICLECKNALIKKLIAAFYKYIKLRLNTRVYALSPGPDVCASSIYKTVKDRDRIVLFLLSCRGQLAEDHIHIVRERFHLTRDRNAPFDSFSPETLCHTRYEMNRHSDEAFAA